MDIGYTGAFLEDDEVGTGDVGGGECSLVPLGGEEIAQARGRGDGDGEVQGRER